MKKHPYWLPVLAIAASVVLIAAGTALGGRFARLLPSIGCALIGVSAIDLIRIRRKAALPPEERRAEELKDTDERSAAIREKAAMDSWFCTAAMLFALWVISVAADAGRWAEILTAAAALLHCAVYLVNVARWSARL